jgi:hypothetical protein
VHIYVSSPCHNFRDLLMTFHVRFPDPSQFSITHSETTYFCLDPSPLSIIIVIHFSSRYQFLSTRLFPSAFDVLLRHFVQFGNIITLVCFHLFYLHADVFSNDIEFISVSVFCSSFRFRSHLSYQVTFVYPQRIFSLTCSSHLGVVLELLT